MKICSLLVLVSAALAMQGCAMAPAAETKPDFDTVKVELVNQYAQRNGIQVIWVNYPPARNVAVAAADK